MKKLKSIFLLGALAIGLGLTSCSSDDGLANSQTSAEKGSTYASLSISFPTSSSTRALPDDYKSDGAWTGRDEIKSVSVFLYNSTLNTVDYSKFSASSFTGIDADGKLTPKIAVKATPGQNVKAYVVINDVNNDVVTNTLKNAAKEPKTFDAAFAAEVDAVASKVSAYNTTDKKDVILMTNDVTPTATVIAPHITQDQAIKGLSNLIPVKVQRVVSRAIVTMPSTLLTDPKTNTIQLTDASGNDASKITIKDLKYGVGQSGQSFFNLQHTDFSTPDAIYKGDASIGATAMDNTGLNSFTEVTSIDDNTNKSITGALSTETTGSKFVLPVTHAPNGYFKGNTTYFEIRATFTPDKVDGNSYNPGTDVYLGQNDGLFYSTRELAEASGQKSTCYKGDGKTNGGAITKYILWLNPDVVPGTGGTKASMSPTVRNQVYNVYISGFKTIGIPNNPLNPADPNDTNNPDNPIKPIDPLETQDTYLSVTITVLPYTVHSYGINIGNDY